MKLLLVQHGKSFTRQEDPDRRLTQEGAREVMHIAQKAKELGISVDQIMHSGKKRAQQTAEMFADELQPSEGVIAIEGIGPNDDVMDFSEHIDPDKDIMLVGHLPFLEKFATYMITGCLTNIAIKFQNAGIVCIEKDSQNTNDSYYIKWTLTPSFD